MRAPESGPEVILTPVQLWITWYQTARVFVFAKSVSRHQTLSFGVSRYVLDKILKRRFKSFVITQHMIEGLMLHLKSQCSQRPTELLSEELRCFELIRLVVDTHPHKVDMVGHLAVNRTGNRVTKGCVCQ